MHAQQACPPIASIIDIADTVPVRLGRSMHPRACSDRCVFMAASKDGLQILVGTFGMSPQPFVDMSTNRCAFSCVLE